MININIKKIKYSIIAFICIYIFLLSTQINLKAAEFTVCGIGTDDTVLFKNNVTSEFPKDNDSEWIKSGDETFLNVSIGSDGSVWAVGLDDKNIYVREGITPEKPEGESWKKLDEEKEFSQVSVGNSNNIWAVNDEKVGGIYQRVG